MTMAKLTKTSAHHGNALIHWYERKHENRSQFCRFIQGNYPDSEDQEDLNLFNRLVHMCRQLERKDRFYKKDHEKFQDMAGQYIGITLSEVISETVGKESAMGSRLIEIEKEYYKEKGKAEAWEESYRLLIGKLGTIIKEGEETE